MGKEDMSRVKKEAGLHAAAENKGNKHLGKWNCWAALNRVGGGVKGHCMWNSNCSYFLGIRNNFCNNLMYTLKQRQRK